jgi:pyruvate/2-oxoglutarate dehydrogenase complex dihydrolipoamide acyltransferase (E2) component
VKPGDRVEVEDGLISLESDKASMDVPSPVAGTVKEIKVSAGDQVAQGDVIALIEAEGEEEASADEPEAKEEPAKDEEGEEEKEPEPETKDEEKPAKKAAKPAKDEAAEDDSDDEATEPARRDEPLDEDGRDAGYDDVYASPSIRRFGRELGVDLVRYCEAFGAIRRAISVVKTRTGWHEPYVRELQIGNDGLTIGEPLRRFSGVLSGRPEFTGDLGQLAADES